MHKTPHEKEIKKASKHERPDFAKISIVEAIETASKQVKGEVVSASLHEEGGHVLYKIEMVESGAISHKLKIDAETRAMVELKTKNH